MTFEEAVRSYLSEPCTKSGNPKSKAAIMSLTWMMRKVPQQLKDPASGKVYRYTKNRAKSSPNLEFVLDETSGRFVGRQMSSISQIDVTNMRTALRLEKGLSDDGINNYLIYLRALINYAELHLEVDFNKKPKIETLKGNRRKGHLTPKDARSLIKHLDPLRAGMFEMALATGQRNANIRLMKWDWIKGAGFEKALIPHTSMKNGEAFMLYFTKEAKAVLKRRWEIREEIYKKRPDLAEKLQFVFVQTKPQFLGETLASGTMTNDTWKKAVSQAGVKPDTVFHHARHTFASWHLEGGTRDKELMEVGNWKSLSSMADYQHLNEGRKKEVGRKLEGKLLE